MVLLLCCCALLALVYGILLDAPKVGFGSSIRHDHQLHVVTFFVLTAISTALWSPADLLAGFMVAGGGALELTQGLCGREMSLGDWASSSAGVALGIVLFAPTVRNFVLRACRGLIRMIAAVDRSKAPYE